MGYLGDDFSGNSGLNSSSWQWKLTIHNDDREHLKTEGAENEVKIAIGGMEMEPVRLAL